MSHLECIHTVANRYLENYLKIREEASLPVKGTTVVLAREQKPKYFVGHRSDLKPVFTHEPRLAKRLNPLDAELWITSLFESGIDAFAIWPEY